jgi:hypothetical protein
MRAGSILGAVILLTGCGEDGGPSDDLDLSGVWALSGAAESTGELSGACTFAAGTLALTQTGTTAGGTIDGRVSCDIPEIGAFTDDVDDEPVEGIQVDGTGVSWSQDNCEFTGEAQNDDRIEGDLNCTTSYLGAPVNIVGTWQMSR